MSDDQTMVSPGIGYRNAPAAIRFLVDAFGFEEVRVYRGETDDKVNHAELRWPGGGLVTVHSAEDHLPPSGDPKQAAGAVPSVGIHIRTGDPDALFDRAVAAGAEVVREPTDSPHGTRDFMVDDPEGLCWSFGTPLPNPIPGIPESPKYTE